LEKRVDETYGMLAHPIRRHIIEFLKERNELSFNELGRRVAVSNHGKLAFHLKALKGFVEPDSLTNKYRLTDRGQLAAELIWDTRLLISRDPRKIQLEPRRYVRHLRLGDHAVLFYDTEDIKRDISYPFLQTGLLKGEAVVYIVSEHKLDAEEQEIKWHGINFDQLREKAFTIISAEEWYIRKGRVHAETLIANAQTLINEKQTAGFTGIRFAAEIGALIENATSKELLRYEALLNRQFPLNVCVLCSYDTNRLDEETFIQLNQSHGHSIFKGIALKTR